jgi:hypothetical protein
MIDPSKVIRDLAVKAAFFLPEDKRRAFERRLRGRQELRKLDAADAVVVSYGKSGRTWLMIMLVHYYQTKFKIGSRPHRTFRKLREFDRRVPNIFFTHDNYVKDYSETGDSKDVYRGKKVVLLARHPADTAVSQFFQWRNRMRPAKRWLNRYPADLDRMSLFDFVTSQQGGVPGIIDFLNGWRGNMHKIDRFLMVKYEEMRADPEGVLARIVRFIGEEPDPAAVRKAVEFASFENLRQFEEQSARRWFGSRRLKPADRDNPDSYKVRRGKVGGYRDYFDDRQVAEIDALVGAHLDPYFGYTPGGREGGDAGAGAAPWTQARATS